MPEDQLIDVETWFDAGDLRKSKDDSISLSLLEFVHNG